MARLNLANNNLLLLLVLLLMILLAIFKSVETKDLKIDLLQIQNVVEEWDDELEGHDEVDADTIPEAKGEPLYIMEKFPENNESQAYIVYKQNSVDTTKYTRHAAYLRRFKAISAVEWNPIENPEDNIADGDFIELFLPSLFSQKRCNSIINTPARAVHNYFYRTDDNCTIPNPYQDCCGKEGSVFEEIDLDDIGKAIDAVDEDYELFMEQEAKKKERKEEGLDYEYDDDEAVGAGGKPLSRAARRKKYKLRQKLAGMSGRGIRITKIKSEDELENLQDALKNIEGPPGFFALGEFYAEVLDLTKGSQMVYEARERVLVAAKESKESGLESQILAAETMMMTSADVNATLEGAAPSFEDPHSAFTGYLACNYTKFQTAKPAYDRMKTNVIKYYLHKLRGQCVVNAYDKALALFEDHLSVTTGLRVELNAENEALENELLTKQEWLDLISAVFFMAFSNSYMDVAERMSRGVSDNRNPVGQEISWTVRTLTLMATRIIRLVQSILSTHVVKTLQITAYAIKEKLISSLYEDLKVENYCESRGYDCTEALQVLHNDQLHLLALMQFVVFGSSDALQREERMVEDEFNSFYVKTVGHMEKILENVHAIRANIEASAMKQAVQDKEEGLEFRADAAGGEGGSAEEPLSPPPPPGSAAAAPADK